MVPSARTLLSARHLELERAEAPGEGDLLVARQVLVGEDQQRVVEPCRVERAEVRLVEFRHLHAAHDGAEGRIVDRLDVEGVGHVGPPS